MWICICLPACEWVHLKKQRVLQFIFSVKCHRTRGYSCRRKRRRQGRISWHVAPFCCCFPPNVALMFVSCTNCREVSASSSAHTQLLLLLRRPCCTFSPVGPVEEAVASKCQYLSVSIALICTWLCNSFTFLKHKNLFAIIHDFPSSQIQNAKTVWWKASLPGRGKWAAGKEELGFIWIIVGILSFDF